MKSYITYLDYGATGEGHTVEMLLVRAETKKIAIEEHLTFFKYPTQKSKNYFRVDVDVYKVNDPKLLELLKNMNWFANPDKLYLNLNVGMQEFHIKYYYDLS